MLLVKFGGGVGVRPASYLDHCRTAYLVSILKEGSILRQKTIILEEQKLALDFY